MKVFRQVRVTESVGLRVLINAREIDRPVVAGREAQASAPAADSRFVDVGLDELCVVKGPAREKFAARTDPENIVDVTRFFGVETYQAQRRLVVCQRDVDHGADVITRIAVLDRRCGEINPAVELRGVRLVGEDAQRATLRSIAEQRALGSAESLNPLDVHQPWIRIESGNRDRLLVQVHRGSRGVGEGDARRGAAPHDDVSAARFPPGEGQGGNLPDVVVELLKALADYIFVGKSSDGHGNVLQVGLPLGGRNDDFLDTQSIVIVLGQRAGRHAGTSGRHSDTECPRSKLLGRFVVKRHHSSPEMIHLRLAGDST